jgi:NAD(P)-dependent dehydrogenase (short-subunit alcohol dehydrogenase family)
MTSFLVRGTCLKPARENATAPYESVTEYSQSLRAYVNMKPLVHLHSKSLSQARQQGATMKDKPHPRIVMVTGATSGIGRAVARRFASASDRVIAVGRDAAALDEVAADIVRDGDECSTIRCDVTNDAAVDKAFESVTDETGRLNVLVNAAGHISTGSIENTSLTAWDAMMNVNLRAVFHLMQIASPLLIQSKGNIVNISSVTGLRSFPGVLAYCVSKAGLDQLTRCAALELAPKGVRVNAVNPGVVVTEIHKRGGMNEEDYRKFLEHSKTTHPLGRVGDPGEIAELVFYLASENAGWITGATYQIDGGRALTCAR